MAQSSNQLSAAQMSKMTDMVSARNSFRFCVEYLEIDPKQYETIQSDAKFIHHDTLFQCIDLWRNKVEGEGLNASQELVELMTMVQEERLWFSKQDLAVLFDGDTVIMSSKRK